MQSCLAESTTLAAIFLKSESTIGNISAAPTYTKEGVLNWIKQRWESEVSNRRDVPGPARPTAEVAVGLEWTRTSLKIGLGKKWSRVHLRAYVLCSLSSIPITTTCFSDDPAISKTTAAQTNTPLLFSLPSATPVIYKPIQTHLSIIESLLNRETLVWKRRRRSFSSLADTVG